MEKKTITKDMYISELLDVDPQIEGILLQVGMHCIGCLAAHGETIEEACAVHELDADKLVDILNAYEASVE